MRRALVETLTHGDRAKLVEALDESLLGVRARPGSFAAQAWRAETLRSRHIRSARSATSVQAMDQARAVLTRLERIDALKQADAPAGVLLDEVRALLSEAEAWVAADRPGEIAEDALTRSQEAFAEGARDADHALAAR